MVARRIAFVLVVAALGLAGGARSARGVSAAPRCFAETNQCIAEPFLSYWEGHGGLAINGFPITDVFMQTLDNGKPYQVQYFERARFELHPENAAPYDVLLGAFGRSLYLIDPGQSGATLVQPLPGATYFTQTGHNLRGRFLDYWTANGGLPQFGFPISEEFQERLENGQDYTVQYFERARFEYHPENAAPYDVLLGQFGRRIAAAFNPNAPLPFLVTGGRGELYRNNVGVRVRLNLPTAAERQEQGVVQPFERGTMLYRYDTKTIYVIAKDAGTGQPLGRWLSFADTWTEGQEPGGGPAPVPNLYFPQRGFGKVWREHSEVQQLLGYSLTPDETVKTLVTQPFVGGLLVNVVNTPNQSDYRNSPGIYLLYTNGRFEFQYSYGP